MKPTATNEKETNRSLMKDGLLKFHSRGKRSDVLECNYCLQSSPTVHLCEISRFRMSFMCNYSNYILIYSWYSLWASDTMCLSVVQVKDCHSEGLLAASDCFKSWQPSLKTYILQNANLTRVCVCVCVYLCDKQPKAQLSSLFQWSTVSVELQLLNGSKISIICSTVVLQLILMDAVVSQWACNWETDFQEEWWKM